MSHWRVELDCWQRVKPRSRYAQLVSMTFIVEADVSDDAFKQARNAAGLTKANGWLSIEDRGAYSIKLPIRTVVCKGRSIKLAPAGPIEGEGV